MSLTAQQIADKYKKSGITTTAGSSRQSLTAESIAEKYKKTSTSTRTFSSQISELLGKDAPYAPRNVDEADKLKKENPTIWGRISKELMKPVGVVATLAEQTGKAIGGEGLTAITDTPRKVGGILSGTTERSFIDVFKDNWDAVKVDDDGGKNVAANFWNDGMPLIVGLITDIAADPLNFVGGGLTTKGKIAEKVSNLNKIKETVAADSKMAEQIKAFGLTPEMLNLGKTKADQVRNGQRALLTVFGNTRFEKTLYGGASIYEKMSDVSRGIEQTKIVQNMNKIFSTKTTNEAFNIAKENAVNLMAYREGKVMDESIKINTFLGRMPVDDAKKVIDLVETAGGKSIKVVDDATALASTLQSNLADINKTEKGLGLRLTEIQDYFPHQLLKPKQDEFSAWQKFKSLFQKADGTVEVDKFGDAKMFSTSLDAAKERKYAGTISDIKKNFGIDFQDNAAIAYAKRALGSAKAVTSKEFFDSVKQFAISDGTDIVAVPVKVKSLDGLKFAPDVARQIDQYYTKVKPEELGKALKAFDSVQNWWKAQALLGPSYHTRNFVGNMWNNFLAGIVDPRVYVDAGKLQQGKSIEFTDDIGRMWNNDRIIKAAKQSGVINDGWYAKDIDVALTSDIAGGSWNPLKQNFGLFRANRALGTASENNARIAHFISKLREGDTIENAAASVKKYLFDYGELTEIEKGVFKRLIPFYTWTRKNIPLQMKKLFQEPEKFAAISKATKAIESGVEKPDERYLGDYIKNNVGVRVGTDKEGNTLYFLMGNWLPAAQAIDFLSQPIENFVQSVSPFIKTPIETWSNQSSYFKDSFGKPSKIERYPKENQSFLGFTMRKKVVNILKNIRVLNELDKLNPGSIFGDKENPSLANRIAPESGFKFPLGIGEITTSEKRSGKLNPETTTPGRILEIMFGKTTVYNPAFSRKYYLWDKDTKIRELEKAAKDAQRDGQAEYSKRLRQEIVRVKKGER